MRMCHRLRPRPRGLPSKDPSRRRLKTTVSSEPAAPFGAAKQIVELREKLLQRVGRRAKRLRLCCAR